MIRQPGARLTVTGDPDYPRLKAHLIAATGLAYYRDRDEELGELLGRRLAQSGAEDCRSYLGYLEQDAAGGAELDGLVAELTIGETYFFRDRQQFDAIRDRILPEILERRRATRRLRIWSAGCATGAEPYSLAILLDREMGDRLAGWEVTILATDINRRFLTEAREGRFPEWAFRTTEPGLKRECFTRDAALWKIQPAYQRRVSFEHFNLVESAFPSVREGIAELDLILCRNVMIYFDAETTRRLIRQFHASLRMHGWFLVGSAEPNLESFTAFQAVHGNGATLYQKTETVSPSVFETRLEEMPAALPAPPLAQALAPEPADPEAAPAEPDELNAGAHFHQALLQEQLGHTEAAERSLRQAIYLDRSFALAHYHLGLRLQRNDRLKEAKRSFENVLRLLRQGAREACVRHDQTTTVATLARLSRKHLAELENA